MKYGGRRRRIVALMAALAARDLGVGCAGNASVRAGKGFLITPSGVDYAALRPADLVLLDAKGAAAGAGPEPSSEWRMHRDLYRAREAVGAVLHLHSPHASALSCLRRDLPPFHYMVARFGGRNVRCAKYASYGTAALSRNALAALRDRNACLLANHGQLTVGADLEEALQRAVELESLCRQYLLACAAGKPVLLGEAEMRGMLRRFRDYGKPRSRKP